MISFVNAKINLGLNVVARRADGYHDLSTVFYPVGVYSGTPENTVAFADALEIVERPDADHQPEAQVWKDDEYLFLSRKVECPVEKNLVCKAVVAFRKALEDAGRPQLPSLRVILSKHLPDGAGLGGGSADATFTLKMLNAMAGSPFDECELIDIAAKIGADCPFFVVNSCAYASGIGERLERLSLSLAGKWLLIVKPDLYVSTKEAFAGITPHAPAFDLLRLPEVPLKEWHEVVVNDFEASLFPSHPELAEIKNELYACGAQFALMSGSGSSLYGIFENISAANAAAAAIGSTQRQVWLLKL